METVVTEIMILPNALEVNCLCSNELGPWVVKSCPLGTTRIVKRDHAAQPLYTHLVIKITKRHYAHQR